MLARARQELYPALDGARVLNLTGREARNPAFGNSRCQEKAVKEHLDSCGHLYTYEVAFLRTSIMDI
jgi:hypothetical protein